MSREVHSNRGGFALCKTTSDNITSFTKLVTCKKCIKLMGVPRSYEKNAPVDEKTKEKIFAQWLSGENNSYRRLAKDYGCTYMQAREIINAKYAEYRKSRQG